MPFFLNMSFVKHVIVLINSLVKKSSNPIKNQGKKPAKLINKKPFNLVGKLKKKTKRLLIKL